MAIIAIFIKDKLPMSYKLKSPALIALTDLSAFYSIGSLAADLLSLLIRLLLGPWWPL